MRILGALFGIVIIASSARAQDNTEQLAKCAAFESPALRLTCYDDLAKGELDTSRASSQQLSEPDTSSASSEELSADQQRIENWLMSMDTDPMTDQKGVTFLLEAEGSTRVDNPTLGIRCKRGELDVLFAPDDYLGRDNNRVTLRFGNDRPVSERWNPSTGHSALFVPGNREKVEAFVRKLGRYNRLAIQVQPYNEGPQAMVFDLTGIGQVSQELWKVCPPKSK